MNKRKIKSFRTYGRVNTRGVRVTDPEKIRILNSDAIPFMSESELLMTSLIQTSSIIQPRQPSTSGCTASSSGGKHVWYKKGHCYYQCGNCKYYKTYHENYDSPTCTSKGYCDCGDDYKPALGHLFYSDEKYCQRSGCNAVNPNYSPPVPPPSISYISFSNITYNSFRVSVSGSNIAKYKYVVCERGSSVQVENTGVTTSSSYTITGSNGLKSGTEYKVEVYVWNSAGDSGYDYDFCTTQQATPLSPPSLTIKPTVGGVDLSWSAPSGANNLHYTLVDTVTSGVTKGNQMASYGSVSVTGLVKDRKYKIYAYYSAKTGYSDSSNFESSFTTLNYPTLPAPVLTCTPALTSVTITWTPPTGAQSIYISLGNATQSQAEITRTVTASNRTVTITGLYAGCRYNVYAYYVPTTGYLQSITSSTSFNTTAKPTFAWSTTVSSGSAFNITASDWNKLCATINSWRQIKGYSAYSFTTASRGSRLTADMFNQARTALSAMTSDIPEKAVTGEKCYASQFKKFETSIKNLTQ